MKRAGVVLIALTLLLLAGCGRQAEQEEHPSPSETVEPVDPPKPEVQPPPEESPEEPEPYVPSGQNPLTGEPMEPEDAARRPVAVMLNNLKAAQPQLGISQADIVYEVTAEGGITRMLGVYQNVKDIPLLGSVRSTRPYYIELALGHDAILVHAGGSQEAYSNLRKWKVDRMDGVRGTEDAKIFWRDADRRRHNGYEHSMVTSGENILAYIDGHFQPEHRSDYLYPQTFAEDGTMLNGAAAEHVKVRFSGYKTGTFDYDPVKGAYLAGQYGAPHIDGSTDEQVSAVNLLVLETKISVLDSEGRQRVTTTGEGKGTYFCGGKAVEIQWSREDRDAPFVYRTQDGEPLVLGQGKSYVCIISPKVSSVSYE